MGPRASSSQEGTRLAAGLTPARRYSKSSAFYLAAKRNFFAKNDARLKESLGQNRLYRHQPRRTACKLCSASMLGAPDLTQHGVSYAFCGQCGHLNGLHEDTAEFAQTLYVDKDQQYAADYVDPDFQRRVREVYAPKVDFLVTALPTGLSILDVGCGAGHFVYAALIRKIRALGIDVSQAAVDFGNQQIQQIHHLLGRDPLTTVDESDIYDTIRASDASVISAVGVLEHLRKPRRFITAVRESKADYLYFSVPMFSLSVLLENAFYTVYPRHLSGAHTHLFTEESLNWLYGTERLTPVAEWRFGTDALDLYRSLRVSLGQTHSSAATLARLDKDFGPVVDALQGALDRAHFCSEIHVICRIDR